MVFHKLYDEINVIVGKQDDHVCTFAPSPLSPSAPLIPVSPLTQSAPLPPPSPFTPPLRPLAPLILPAPLHSPVTQVPPYPPTPTAPSLLSTVVQVESNKIPYKHTQASSKPSTTSRNMPLASTKENISNKPPCKLYMQGKCKNGKRGTNCSFPHPNMCFRFIRQSKKGCNKGASCQYAHPKLCRASLTSKRCDRRNCYYYHVAGTLRTLTDVVPPKTS